jgi:serine/threonine-protein kinase RsbW
LSTPKRDQLRLPADLEYLHGLKSFILDYASQKGFDKRKCHQIELAADEILTNIISYAYPEEKGDIRVICDSDEDGALLVQIIDTGVPFNPFEVDEPDLSLGLEERKVGGLGLFLAHKMVDEIRYRRQGAENILTLYKRKTD